MFVHHEDERVRLVSTGGLLLVHVRMRFTYREIVRIHTVQEHLRATVGRHGIIMIVSDVRAELSERTRTFARRTSDEFADWVVGLAHVIEPRGFVGAAVRCVMAGMRALNRPPYPVREFTSSPAAAMWMAPVLADQGIELGIDASADGIHEWLEQARTPGLLDSGSILVPQ